LLRYPGLAGDVAAVLAAYPDGPPSAASAFDVDDIEQ
jgi:hypothetical protein